MLSVSAPPLSIDSASRRQARPRVGTTVGQLVLLWLIFVPPALAFEQFDLFEVTLNVSGDSRSERQSATRMALETVYQRASGQDSVVQSHPGLRSKLDSASRFLQTYGYTQQERTAGDAAQSPGSGTSAVQQDLLLSLRFSPEAIKSHFRELRIPFWGEQRPLLSTVLVVEQVSTDRSGLVISDLNSQWLRRAAVSAASEVGLPTLLKPAGGQSAAQRFMEASRAQQLARAQASGDEATFLAQISQLSSGKWRGEWTFYWDGVLQQQSHTEQDFKQLLRHGFALARAEFARQLATPLGRARGGLAQQGMQRITLAGVRSIEDYFRLTRYLDSVEGFSGYQIAAFDRSSLAIDLPAQLPAATVKRLLVASGVVEAVDTYAKRYRWSG